MNQWNTNEEISPHCGVREDSWESLGLQGDPTSPFWRRSALGFLWRERCWSWNSCTLATSCEELTHWKRLWCCQGLGAGGEGDDRGWDGWMASPTRWLWVWVNSGSWWWTGRPGMLQFMGCKESDTTERLNWTELKRPCGWANWKAYLKFPEVLHAISSLLPVDVGSPVLGSVHFLIGHSCHSNWPKGAIQKAWTGWEVSQPPLRLLAKAKKNDASCSLMLNADFKFLPGAGWITPIQVHFHALFPACPFSLFYCSYFHHQSHCQDYKDFFTFPQGTSKSFQPQASLPAGPLQSPCPAAAPYWCCLPVQDFGLPSCICLDHQNTKGGGYVQR